MPFLILSIFIIVTIAILCLLYSIYRKVFYNGKRISADDPYAGLSSPYLEGMRDVVRQQIDDLSAYPCEEIRIKSNDGISLYARYYKGESEKPICIMFHGYRGSSHTELSGAALLMLSHGIGALVVDQRAHGKSEGATVSFGIKERFDCLSWTEYVRERFGEEKKIVLFGISMGAATVLMASELNLRSKVRAIVADCPYSSPSAIIKRVLENRGLPPKKVYPIVYLSALVFGRFRLGAASAADAVKHSKTPTLIIHGEDDNFVPPSMSREIHEVCASKKTLFTVAGAKHGASFAVGQEKYVHAVLSFIDEETA